MCVILMHKNIFLQHLHVEPGPKVGVPALMLAEVVRSHECLVTKSAHELLNPRVNPLVAGQLIAPEIGKSNPYIKLNCYITHTNDPRNKKKVNFKRNLVSSFYS